MDPVQVFLRHLAQTALGGILIAGAWLFLLHDRLRNQPFTTAFVILSLLVLGCVVLADLVILPQQAHRHLAGWRFAFHVAYWGLLMGGTVLALRLNDQYGNASMVHLLDRYRRPRQELRIFMFLDLRSSTSVAESIGDTRYFNLLNDLYADIADPVMYSDGEIYQYVGDEISVSWRLERGIRNQRCIRCFFAIRGKLRKRAEHYRKKYGIEPVFKAGFHFGRVTSGVVGQVRRQTIFSGDVVNTTAHIQANCNVLGVDNLVSKELLEVLPLDRSPFVVRPMGSIPLKGKRDAVELFTLDLRDQ
jgi:adenylate cyclase